MSRGSKRETLPPQVNAGNVGLALQGIRTASDSRPICIPWLEDLGINQPRQTLTMLRFLQLLEESDRLAESVIRVRDTPDGFQQMLREQVIVAYADAGCGTHSTLGWLGRDRLATEDIRERIAGRGPFSGRDMKKGGARNALYTLCALHDLLLNSQWLNSSGGMKDRMPHGPAAMADSAELRSRDARQPAEVIDTKHPDTASARQFVQGLLDASSREENSAIAPPAPGQRFEIPFDYDEAGSARVAQIQFRAPMRPGDLARLGRVLQGIAKEMVS